LLIFIVTITGRYIYAVITVSVTITGRYICSINMYYDKNAKNSEVYRQC